MMTEAIANNGQLCQPEIKNRNFDGKNLKAKCQDLKLGSTTLGLVKEGMKEVCSSGGTAYPFFDFSPQIAGKTGTAQFR
jgi:cell division protein FtsI/penicillin-binding protein 2